MILSVPTHWMVSQAIFVASVLSDGGQNLDGGDGHYYVTCGYPPVAILGVIILGVSILVYTVWVGYRPLKESAMPVAGSNSMLIEQ